MTRKFTKQMRGARRNERGVALLLTLFVVLIVAVIVMQLAVTTTAEYAVSNNVTTIVRLDSAIDAALVDARKALLDDAQSAGDSGAGGQGGLPGGLPGGAGGGSGMPTGGGGAAGDSGAQDTSDSLNDAWANDQETSIADVSVRIHVEDENRKFNVLCLVSKDQEFAKQSYDRLVRLIDMMREVDGGEAIFDIETSRAEKIATGIRQWLDGSDRRGFARPDLLSNQTDSQIALPFTIDEFLFIEGVDERILYDQKHGGLIYPGLASVLTVWTALEAGPVKKDSQTPSTPGGSNPPTGGGNPPSNPTEPASDGGIGAAGKKKDTATASGKSAGVKININTAPPCVLRSLLPTFEIPLDVIDALIRFRNSLDEEKLNSQREAGEYSGGDLPAGVDAATKIIDRSSLSMGEMAPPSNAFASVEDLNKVEEWKSFTNETAKKEFMKLITTQSDVFSIYVTARPTSGFGATDSQRVDAFNVQTLPDGTVDPEEIPGGVLRRVRQVVWRRTGKSEPVLLPVIVREERFDRKCAIPDYQVDPATGKPRF